MAADFSHLFVTDDLCILFMSWVLDLETGRVTMLFFLRESTWEFYASGQAVVPVVPHMMRKSPRTV